MEPPSSQISRSSDKKAESSSPNPKASPPPRRSKLGERKSNFSEKPPSAEEIQARLTTEEKLAMFKQTNPSHNLSTHSKSDRQLYVGNIPPGLSVPQLMELLNKALREIGAPRNQFQAADPITSAWISNDGHYAFVDFRTLDDAEKGYCLSQVSIHGNNLKVGKPKSQQAIDQAGVSDAKMQMNLQFPMGGMSDPAMALMNSMNLKLQINNFPNHYVEAHVKNILEVFGKITELDMIKDPVTGEFRGTVHAEYSNEAEAKRALSGLMGMKVEDCLLFVKKLTAITAPSGNFEGEVFKSLIEDRATTCLMLKNIVKTNEIESRDQYKELEQNCEQEMLKYGKVIKVHIPKPTMIGDPYTVPGFGKVYVRFENEKDCEKAKHSIYKRRFNDRYIEALFYPEEKFRKMQFD